MSSDCKSSSSHSPRQPRPLSSPSFPPAPRDAQPPTSNRPSSRLQDPTSAWDQVPSAFPSESQEPLSLLAQSEATMNNNTHLYIDGGKSFHNTSVIRDRTLAILRKGDIEVHSYKNSLSLQVNHTSSHTQQYCGSWYRQPLRVCLQFEM